MLLFYYFFRKQLKSGQVVKRSLLFTYKITFDIQNSFFGGLQINVYTNPVNIFLLKIYSKRK